MVDGSKLVTAIALAIAGLIVAILGVVYIWFYKKDQNIIASWVNNGQITAANVAQLTNPTWWWVLPALQILVGVFLIGWGLFQYFANPSDVYAAAKGAFEGARNGIHTTRIERVERAGGSRRSFNEL